MAKKKKLEPLRLGQRVWLELHSSFIQRDSTIEEYEVISSNNSSAYVARVTDIGTDSPVTYRISQVNRKVSNPYSAGYYYTYWESKEQWERAKQRQADKKRLRKVAEYIVSSMTLEELKEFTGQE